MGILQALLGQDNPLTQWAGQNQNWLGSVGSGIANGLRFNDLGQANQMDATAQRQKMADAKVEQTTNYTINWLKKTHPDLAQMVEAGMPISEAWQTALQRQQPKAPADPIKLGAGDTLVDPITFKPVFSVPKPPEMQPGMMEGPGGSQVPVPGGKEAFDRADALWKEYQAAEPVKSYQMVRNGYERLRSASQLNNGAGDVSMIFAYMKMLDPTSVVREGEFATAEQTGGIPAQITNLYNKLLNGERLTPEQRQQFVSAGDGLYKESVDNLKQANDQYGGRAKTWGVDPSTILSSPEQYQPLTFGAPKTKVIGGVTFTQDANGDWYQQ